MHIGKYLLLSALLLSSQWAGAQEQIVAATPAQQDAGPNSTLSFDAIYSTDNPVDETLTGLGLRVHFNSTALDFINLTNTFDPGRQPIGPVEDDLNNFDNDPDTDKFVVIAWLDASGNWPGVGATPLRLFTAEFATAADFSGETRVNFSTSSLAAGFDFQATSAAIQSGDAIAAQPVPALGPWGFALLMLLLGIFGIDRIVPNKWRNGRGK